MQKINTEPCSIIKYIQIKDKSGNIHTIPVLDIPLLSDEEWQKLCEHKKTGT